MKYTLPAVLVLAFGIAFYLSRPEIAPPPPEQEIARVPDEVIPVEPAESVAVKHTTETRPRPAEPLPKVVPAAPSEQSYRRIGFDFLGSFDYLNTTSVPAGVRALTGSRIQIQGFMLPTEFSENGVRAFVFGIDQSACCYGITPPINCWIDVRMAAGKTAPYLPDEPIILQGVLRVGEWYDGDDLIGLYKMTGEHVESVFK